MNLKFTILGCGSSSGVPRVGGDWGACDPANARNRRRRCSLLVEQKSDRGLTSVLIDISPDAREQLLDAEVKWVDGVLITHDHADHIHGIDDLRALALINQRRVDVYMDQVTASAVTDRFGYCFKTPPGSLYQPIMNSLLLNVGEPVTISGEGGHISAVPFLQHHGEIDSLGFRFGGLAYSSDLHDLPENSIPHLKNLDVWIVDCLRYKEHKTHFNLETTLMWIDRLKPRQAILTNMHVDLDYDTLCGELPGHIIPGYDGMVVNL